MKRHFVVDRTRIFPRSTLTILDLILTGRPNLPREETLLLRRILEIAKKPRAAKGFVRVRGQS